MSASARTTVLNDDAKIEKGLIAQPLGNPNSCSGSGKCFFISTHFIVPESGNVFPILSINLRYGSGKS